MRSSAFFVAAVAAVASVLLVTGCGSEVEPASEPSLPTDPAPSDPPTTSTTPVPTTASTEPTDTSQPEPPPVDTSGLFGIEWIAESYITVGGLDTLPAGIHASLRFTDDGMVEVNTGCNSGSGAVSFDNEGVLTVTALGQTEKACEPDVMAVETRLLAQLAEPLYWSVDGDVLTIYPVNITDTGTRFRDASSTSSSTTVADVPLTTAAEPNGRAATQLAILTAVAVERVLEDNSFGGGSVFDSLAIVDKLGIADESATIDVDPDSILLTEDERVAIETALAPASVRWIASNEEVIPGIMGGDSDFDAILTLAVPNIGGATATATSGLYCGGTCGIGSTYTLERAPDGTWTVTGQTGTSWIS